MPELPSINHRAGMILLVGMMGWGASAVRAQEVIVPHSKSAVYNFGPSYYIPPQVSATPSIGVGSSAYPAYGRPYPLGGIYGGGWNQGLGRGWGAVQGGYWGSPYSGYSGSVGAYGIVPRSL